MALFNLIQSYAHLPSQLFSEQQPTPVEKPHLLLFNSDLAHQLNLNIPADTDSLAPLFAGNVLPENIRPIAQAYAGHQFGHFAILGDGRAILLGEHQNHGQRYDVVLKGAGRTPYSRHGDGRAALAPVLREYLVSEAMHCLGIATTRALAVVTTGERIQRERLEQGAILTRIAHSHLRIGTFEYAAATGGRDMVQRLLDYAIARHYPQCQQANNPALAFLRCVGDAQNKLVCDWMRVGFIHGVMNTDNCAISGETLDYGPCAFMDNYDPKTVYSYIDRYGRYAFANQPSIAQWNLARLAETLLELISHDSQHAIALAEAEIDAMGDAFHCLWLEMMCAKLGLIQSSQHHTDDAQLIDDLLVLLQRQQADYTNTFIKLTEMAAGERPISSDDPIFQQWLQRWHLRRMNEPDQCASLQLMRASNPLIIPRNHQVQAALSAAEHGDLMPFINLQRALSTPYTISEEYRDFQSPPTAEEVVHNTFCGT